MTPDRRSFIAVGAGLAASGASRPPLAKAIEPVEKPGKTKNTKFAVNLEMWWGKEKNFLKKLEYTAALGFPAVELWPWENKDVNAVAETCEARSRHRPVHRLGLQARAQRPEEPQPVRREDRQELRDRQEVEVLADVRRRRRRHRGHVAGEDAREHHRRAAEGRADRGEARRHAHPGADEHPRRSQGPLPVRLRADAEDHQGA